MLVLAALAGATTTGATAAAATPPPGAAISDSLQYIGRVPDSSHIVEGKFDTVMGRDVLVTTGTYGFRIYDVRDAAHPKALDTLQPPEVLGKNGYWQDEDMEIDTQAQADHRRARSPPRRRRPDELPGHRPAQRQEPQPEVPLGLLRHLLQGPAPPAAGRALQRGAGGPHHELHRRLPLRVDRRPGAPRRSGLPGPVRARRARGRPADLGHGPAQSGEAAHVPQADRPEAQRRLHGLLARRGRRRQRVRLGQRPRRPARLRDQGPLARPEDRPRPRGAPVGSGAGGRRRASRAGTTASPAADGLHPQRDAADERARARGRGPQEQRGADDRGGLHGALRPGRPHRRRGHHELARR